MPERLRFEDEDDNSAVEAAKRGYSAADSLNRVAESSAKRQQKRAIKKEYAARRYESLRREGESAAKVAEKTSKAASTAAEKVVEFLKEHKKGVAIAFGVIALLLMFTSFTSSCSVMIEGLLGSLSATTYPSKPEDMLAVEVEYCRMEKGLEDELSNYAETHHGYDEYRISGEVLGHDPYVLASALSAIYGEYSLDNVNSELYEIFDLQYLVEEKSITETRYRTETRTGYREVTDPETGESSLEEYSYEVEVAYDYTICIVTLTSKPLESVVDELLTDEQKQIYEILMKTKGNYPDLFKATPHNHNKANR